MATRAQTARDANLRAFAQRGWADAARAKAEYWAAWSQRHSAREAIALVESARVQVMRTRPDAVSLEARRADLECHLRVSEALRRASRQRPR